MPTNDILALVEACPEAATADEAYVAALVESAKAFIVDYCNLPAFPDFTRGRFAGGTEAAVDLTALGANTLRVALHGGAWREVALDLAACTGGAATAAALEEAIQAVADGDYVWSAVEVAWSETAETYTVTSPVYGEGSTVAVSFDPSTPQVAMAMRLAAEFGGVATPGTGRDAGLDLICAQMVIDAVRHATVGPTQYLDGSVLPSEALALLRGDSPAKSLLLAHRRLMGVC